MLGNRDIFFGSLFVLFLFSLGAQPVAPEFEMRSDTARPGEKFSGITDIAFGLTERLHYSSSETDLGDRGIEVRGFLEFLSPQALLKLRKKTDGRIVAARLVGYSKATGCSVLRINWESTGRVEGPDPFTGDGVSYFVVSPTSAVEVATYRVKSYAFSAVHISWATLNDYQSESGFCVTFLGGLYSDRPLGNVQSSILATLEPSPKVRQLSLSPDLATFDDEENFRLNDANVNFRASPSLDGKVLRVLTGDEVLGSDVCVLVPGVVREKSGFWVRVSTANHEVGWIWHEYITKIGRWYILPPGQYLSHYRGDSKAYTRNDLAAFLKSVQEKDLDATRAVLKRGFNFGLFIDMPEISATDLRESGDGLYPRLYFLGLMGNDSAYIAQYLSLLLQFKGNLATFDTRPDFGDETSGLYGYANPICFAVRIRNMAAIDGILSAIPELLTMRIYSGSGRLFPPPIVSAIVRDDIETTAYLLNKGFPANWIYDIAGEGSMGRSGLYSNLLCWSKSEQMTQFLQAQGVPPSFRFPRPFGVTIPVGTVLTLESNRTNTVTLTAELKTPAYGSLSQTRLVSESEDDSPKYSRDLLVEYKGKEYIVDFRSVDYGALFDR